MKKSQLRFIFLAMALFTGYVSAENRAVEISIIGRGPAVDGYALQTVQQVIGNAVADGIIDKFVVSGYAIEGGFSACAQASPRTDSFVSFVRQLRTITPNSKTTAYSVKPVAACADAPAVCAQDAKLCPDGSYVSRVPPSCAFAACPGN